MTGLHRPALLLCALLVLTASAPRAAAEEDAAPEGLALEVRVPLTAAMVTREGAFGNPEAMVDEQDAIGDPPSQPAESAWEVPWPQAGTEFPASAQIDLGKERHLSALWIFDTFNVGELVIEQGRPAGAARSDGTPTDAQWDEVARLTTDKYLAWTRVELDVATRYLRITRLTPEAIFAEIALYEYTPAGLAARAEQQRREAERQLALARAAEEARNRPLVDLGPMFGRLPLVDEIDAGAAAPGHRFVEDPAGASTVETILGRPCRVLRKYENEASFVTFRIGEMKLLRPGGAYVLAIDYPEDVPRSLVVLNGGDETSRGFHTGRTFGDAFHPKYVENNNESLDLPLSGRYETFTLLFRLHDRFPDGKFIRGAGPRPLLPEDGFTVTIAQFSAPNIPASAGAAFSRIRLFEVPDPQRLQLPLVLPPDDLPRRHVFWREEMADGVIESRDATQRGLADPLDWYRYKADRAQWLGINTFCKDLLEFGACQGWDSTPHGGNDWVFFNAFHKDLWTGIVDIMGRRGLAILPYYEYSGSKGYRGLGNQRRATPLTRDDAFTHISWIESANADLTDPETLDDFLKMLDLTVVREREKAEFVGAWLRPRSQLPIGFGDATRARFAAEANGGRAVGRRELIDNAELLERYYAWWYGKRREFLLAVRDYLQANGLDDPLVLYTTVASEPGASFPTWERRFVTDDPDRWQERLADPIVSQDKQIRPFPLARVREENLYLEALLTAPLNWGGWEVHHANPPADPHRYRSDRGVLLTHCIHRAYSAISPATFDAFRGPSGLAVVRHYALNEDMMFDADDGEKLGYFVCDIERAGPYCMLTEVLAMAHGDSTYIGYLVGSNFNRGFPEYVRAFHAAYLALPALPSRVLEGASSDLEVVVRAIETEAHGVYLAVVHTGYEAKARVALRLPQDLIPHGWHVRDAVTGHTLPVTDGRITLDLAPCSLQTLRATE